MQSKIKINYGWAVAWAGVSAVSILAMAITRPSILQIGVLLAVAPILYMIEKKAIIAAGAGANG